MTSMSKNNTRELILVKGSEIIRKKGFNNTGIQEILQAADVPKGSFYFYFKSKDDFGLQLLDYYQELMFSMLDRHLDNKSLPPVDRLRSFFKEFLTFYEHNDFTGGCPLGNIAQEMSDLNEQFRLKLKNVFDQIKYKIGDTLKEAQTNDKISLPGDAYTIADFIINCWHGSLMRAKVMKNPQALNIFDTFIFTLLLNNKL